jgi:acetyltransferase
MSARVARFLFPDSLAIVGASEEGMYPAGILRDLQRYGYRGRVYPVNPRRDQVLGLACHPTLTALPEKPDLVVIVTPRRAVLRVLEECLALHIPAAIIITAGFRESDAEGAALESAIRALIHGSDLAVLGPNCAGVANLLDNVTITRLPVAPRPGVVGFVSASGALMMAMQGVFADLQMGLSHLLSLGNQVDVTLTESLAYLVDDPATAVIGAFVEGIDDGRQFVAAARGALQAGKPFVMVKSGRTVAGQQAAATHTAALAGSDRVFQSVARQAGVCLVEDMDELARTLHLFAAWAGRWPRTGRLALVTQSGGMGSLTADLASIAGLELPALSPAVQDALRAMPHLLSFGAFDNPTDVRGAGAVGEATAHTLAPFLADPAFDAVVLLLAKSAVDVREVETAHSLVALASATAKPFCVVWVGQRIAQGDDQTETPLQILSAAGIPVFAQPGDCIRALAHVVAWRQRADAAAAANTRPLAQLSPLPVAPAATQERYLSYDESERLLATVNLPLAPARLVHDEAGAAAAADALGYPVAVKGLAAAHSHKSEAGLVHLRLASADQVSAAVHAMQSNGLLAATDALLVQQMARPGVEVIVGVEQDAQFGPVVVCGPGGVLVELLGDAAFGLAPLTQVEAERLIDATRLPRLLAGFRGAPPADRRALAELLVTVSALASKHAGQLSSMDLNPVIVHETGATIVDARIRWRGEFIQ